MMKKRLKHNLIIISIFLSINVSLSHAKQCSELVYSGARDWFPISYIDDNQRLTGTAMDVAEKIASALGTQLRVIENIPWQRQLNLLDSGSIDLIAAYHNSERAKRYHYSKIFFVEEIKIFQRNNDIRVIEKIEDLQGILGVRPIAASLGDEFDKFSKNNQYILQLNKVDNMFKMLLAERVDFVAVAFSNGMRAVKKLKAENKIKYSNQTIAKNTVHFLFSKNMNCDLNIENVNKVINQLVL